MAYSELIKKFDRIRDYMREFYIYGFKCRDEYTQKSTRSYDDEKRRMESILGDYMKFRQTKDGKNAFISIDSRIIHHNPLYKAWKSKSFTDGDITLHFHMLDILISSKKEMTIKQITDRLIDRFPISSKLYDESTVRKKLQEYADEGIVCTTKQGKNVFYSIPEITDCNEYTDLLDFFSEVAPCGVIGSFILDKTEPHRSNFVFKHHYITGTIDSEITCSILSAISEKKNITIDTINKHTRKTTKNNVVPLRIMQSVQSGRQYLVAYISELKRISQFRIDNILSVVTNDKCENYDDFIKLLDNIQSHIWGVSTHSKSKNHMEHVDFTIKYEDDELFIPKRLEREKRCGTVEQITKNSSKFSADVYDMQELIPWIRTFICRITEINFSSDALKQQFYSDINEMYKMYGLTEE